tara:strand:+ start:4423 stop:4998 length:576 start_codon:yes stop_codon:yes gene_type:complete
MLCNKTIYNNVFLIKKKIKIKILSLDCRELKYNKKCILINYKKDIKIYSYYIITILNKWDTIFCILNSNIIDFKNKEFLSQNYIDPKHYLIKLYIYLNTNGDTFIYALYLLIFYINKNNISTINTNNINKLIFISLIISIKFLDDISFNNKTFSMIGGFKLKNLNKLEILFLKKIDYKLYDKNILHNYNNY